MEKEKYKTLADVAEFFAVSTRTVRNWVHARCPVIIIGQKKRPSYRFKINELEQWLKQEGIQE